MGYRRGYYKKDGTYVQGHFVDKGAINRNSRSKANKSGCLGLLVVLLVAITSMACTTDSTCETKKCSDFSTQVEAQTTFDSDRNCYSNLDRDNDNIACEN